MKKTIKIIRNDDDATVAFAAEPVAGFSAGQLDRELGLRAEVPISDVGAEVARLVALGHTVVCGGAAASKLTAAGADVSQTVRPS